MRDNQILYLLESRVREVERLAADCVLQGEVHRRRHIVVQYCKAAKIPKKKTRNFSWPTLSRQNASYGWPPA